MANGTGRIGNTNIGKKDLNPDFTNRFIRTKADSKVDILIDTQTGVQYLVVKPTDFDNGNTTVSVSALLDGSGFPFIDEKYIRKQ